MKRSAQELENSQPLETADRPLPLSLVMDVLAVMKEAYRSSPKELWGLSRSTDLLAPRGFVLKDDYSVCRYYTRAGEDKRYPIVSVRTHAGFNKPIYLLPGVSRVRFGTAFTYPVVIPAGVTELTFRKNSYCVCRTFNEPLRLPDGIRKLQVSHDFDQPITFPMSLTRIVLGEIFCQPISLPSKLITLRFESTGRFNHALVLPKSLRYLHLGDYFNHPIALHKGLRKLTIGAKFNQPLNLPDGLKELTFNESETEVRLHMTHPLSLPDSLKKLVLWCDSPITHMSKGLKTLEVGPDYTHHVEVPKRLKQLAWYPNRLVSLPKGLKTVVFGQEFQQPVDLPPGLESV